MSVSAYTPNFGLALIDYNSQNWHDDEHTNWSIVDGALGIVQAVPYGAATSTGGLGVDWTTTIAGITSYTAGMRIAIKFTEAMSNGAKTININGLGAKQFYGQGIDSAVQLQQNTVATLVYDGTRFIITDPNYKFQSLLVGSTALQGVPIADDISITNGDNAGITILAPNGKQSSVIFGRAVTDYFGSISVASTTKELVLTKYAGGSASPAVENTLTLKTDRTLSQKQIAIPDSSGGTDFAIANTSNNEVTIAFLAGVPNGIKFRRTGDMQFMSAMVGPQFTSGPKFPVYTVATLPVASSNQYVRVFVSDANSPTWNATVAGGGSVKCPVWSDGVNWKVG